MKRHYFVVVLAHSLHGHACGVYTNSASGRLYVVLALALFGSSRCSGMVSSYLRMTWKVANYSSALLLAPVDPLRNRFTESSYSKENTGKKRQLASLQPVAQRG